MLALCYYVRGVFTIDVNRDNFVRKLSTQGQFLEKNVCKEVYPYSIQHPLHRSRQTLRASVCHKDSRMWKIFRERAIIEPNSFIPLACAECEDSFPFSQASSIPL